MTGAPAKEPLSQVAATFLTLARYSAPGPDSLMTLHHVLEPTLSDVCGMGVRP
jgi:hypothetical protein